MRRPNRAPRLAITLALASLAPATAAAAPDGIRVLTYNTAFVYLEAQNPNPGPLAVQCESCNPLSLPPMGPLGSVCECWPSASYSLNAGRYADMDEIHRADAIADRIIASDQDVVVLNEVFDPNVRLELTIRLAVLGPYPNYISRLRGHAVVEDLTLSDLVDMQVPDLQPLLDTIPDVPEFLDYEAVSGDSGLMVFSKFPFLPLTGPSVPNDGGCGDGICEVRGVNNGAAISASEYAFDVFEDCAEEDCWASKGVGLVKVGMPGFSAYIAFSHLQADYPQNGSYNEDVREGQLETIRDTIVGSIPASERAGAFVMLAGDLNIPGSTRTSAITASTQEWHDTFDPLSPSPAIATDFFACGNGVASPSGPQTCRFGSNGSRMLSEPVGFRHSPTDPMITNADDGARLDYLLHSHGARLCAQYVHVAWDLMADVDGGKAWLSDHLPIRADFAPAGQHCSPSDDPGLFAVTQNLKPLVFGPTDCAASGPNPACHQDEITSPPEARLRSGGSMQWFRIDQAGSYSIRLTELTEDGDADFLVYHHSDLSRPIQPFDNQTGEFGLPYSLPEPPYYIRTFAVDDAGVPDRNAKNTDYSLAVHQHLCRSSVDACFLSPGLALTTPYGYTFPETVDFLSEVRDLYWKFKTSGVAGGQPVIETNLEAEYPAVDFLIEAGGGESQDCVTREKPGIEEWDNPSAPSVLIEEMPFDDVIIDPEDGSWDLDTERDERWVAPKLFGKVDGELATYFLRVTRDADHTDGWNECNATMGMSIAYDTDLTFFAPQKLQMWQELDDDLGAEDNLLVHSWFDEPQQIPLAWDSVLVSIEQPVDGYATRWLNGRPQLRGYYVDSLFPTLFEFEEGDFINSTELQGSVGYAPIHPLFPSDTEPTFISYTDNPDPVDADYHYYYWVASCHMETDLACYEE